MNCFRGIPISAKVTVLMMGVALVSLLSGVAVITAIDTQSLREELTDDVSLIGRMYAEHCVADLAFGYREEARQTLEKLLLMEEIVHAAIYDGKGDLFAHYSRPGKKGGVPLLPTLAPHAAEAQSPDIMEVFFPMSYNGVDYGTLCLNVSTTALSSRISAKVKAFGVLVLCMALLSLIISAFAQRVVSRPLLKLAELVRLVGESKDYSLRSGMDRRDEIGTLAGGFDSMLASLQVRCRERDAAEDALRQAHTLLEEKVAARTAELTLANEELEAFAYSASHDLRAPIRRINGFSALLEQECGGRLGDCAADYLARIRKGCRQMSEVVDDMLKLSRVLRQEMRAEKVDLSSLVAEAVGHLSEAEPGRVIKFKSVPGIWVCGDAGLLREVVVNLLENAWKFTLHTSNAAVEFGAVEQKGEVVYFVRDNGKGFNMEFSDKLFRPFHRLHSQDEFPGTGVGLSTVRRIVERHGGKIWAESAEDKGATFYFTIPARSCTALPQKNSVLGEENR